MAALSTTEVPGVAKTGTLSTSTNGSVFTAKQGVPVRLQCTGTWAGTVKVQRSIDDGDTWNDMTVNGYAWGSFTGNCNEEVDLPTTRNVQYRANFARTSGDMIYRLGH